jgi:hypothetical protein
VFLGISKLKPLISSIINFYCQSILASWPLSLCLILVQILYLTNHYHITHVADSHSPLGFPTSGAHQGSILKLSPTLFSAFIKIFLWCFLLADSTFLFADDTTIVIISDQISTLQSYSIQLCLELINLWLERNGLKLNTSSPRVCCMIYSSKKLPSSLPPSVDGKYSVLSFLGLVQVKDAHLVGSHLLCMQQGFLYF